tara:strand:- start:277 stop:531 length:255 start_codon:yes stop_codon:yes gene_type:complete
MKKQLKKQGDVEEAMAEKLMMFDHLPDECSACVKPFDKTDREMVSSWNVVVRQDEQQVRLYCPTCWSAAQKAVKKVYGELDDIV